MIAKLLAPALPNLHVVAAGLDDLDLGRLSVERDHPPAVARIVRGRRARTRASFFDEASAAFQFPAYFGANWDAFVDCMRDLGQPGAPCVLLVALALELFADEPGALPVLAAVAAQLHEARPFHVVLQDTAGGLPDLEARLRGAGIVFDRITLDPPG
jgi:hypothetical protein